MSLNKKLKDFLNFLLRFGVSAALLWFIFTKIDTEQTITVLRSADLSYIGYAALIFIFINSLVLWRWKIFINALNLSVPMIDVVRYFFIGLFGNLFLPSAIGGDAIKIYGLCRKSSQKTRVVASILLDRLSGFAAISAVATCSFIFGYRFIEDRSLALPIVLMVGATFTLVIVLFNQKMFNFGCRIFQKFPKIKNALKNMHDDIMMLKNKRKEGYKAFWLSCVCHILLAFTYFLVAKALHQDIEFYYFLIFVPIICVASAFPSIGGLGFREAGAAYLFTKIGVDSGVAVSLTLINFSFIIVIGLIGGAVYVSTISSRRIQYHQSNAGIKPEEA